jgi:hypothetical protein
LKAQPYTTLSLTLDKKILSPFINLLQKGFLVKTPTGSTIKDMLCDHYDVDENYLEHRIQTIFLDGKPVDDVDKAMVKNGSNVALSAAMPGLVGSTFRRGGVLASFRSGITYRQEEPASNTPEDVVVSIKLFNLLVNELGPQFLRNGIIIKREDFRYILDDGSHKLKISTRSVELDGEEIPYEQLYSLNGSQDSGNLLFKVFESSGTIGQQRKS